MRNTFSTRLNYLHLPLTKAFLYGIKSPLLKHKTCVNTHLQKILGLARGKIINKEPGKRKSEDRKPQKKGKETEIGGIKINRENS